MNKVPMLMLPILENPPSVCLLHRWLNGLWLADHRWVDLMRLDKAAMILEAFDLEDPGLFLILGDWMEDRGEVASEIQRFRNGNWHQQDYEHASISTFWRQIRDFRNCPSPRVFIRLLQANWKHAKFLKWYSATFNYEQLRIWSMMNDQKLFRELYGEPARQNVMWRRTRPTEQELRTLCDNAKEVCYYLRKKEDLEAWSELWKSRQYYTRRNASEVVL